MKTLEERIREIAAKMEGHCYEVDGYRIPHSVFVEWDRTWDVADDYSVGDWSSDEDLKRMVEDQEASHYEYYSEEIEEYVEEQREKKFDKDPNRFDARTVDSLWTAFKEGFHESPRRVTELPSDRFAREYIYEILRQESEDHKVRDDALDEAKESDFAAYGYPANNFNYPDADRCPVSQKEFDGVGGGSFAEDPEMTMDVAIRHCMRCSYVCWFNDNTIHPVK